MSSRKHRERQRIYAPEQTETALQERRAAGADDPVTPANTVDSFEPDYEANCIVCGESPCVIGLFSGRAVYASHMCGPCTFGDTAESVDPDNW